MSETNCKVVGMFYNYLKVITDNVPWISFSTRFFTTRAPTKQFYLVSGSIAVCKFTSKLKLWTFPPKYIRKFVASRKEYDDDNCSISETHVLLGTLYTCEYRVGVMKVNSHLSFSSVGAVPAFSGINVKLPRLGLNVYFISLFTFL